MTTSKCHQLFGIGGANGQMKKMNTHLRADVREYEAMHVTQCSQEGKGEKVKSKQIQLSTVQVKPCKVIMDALKVLIYILKYKVD